MKLLYLSPSFYPATKYGGPIFSTLNICRELFEKKISLEIHTTNVDRNSRLKVETGRPVPLEALNWNTVTYHNETITDILSFSFLFNIPKVIRKSDIVHTQSIFSMCTPLAILFSALFNKKVVVSPRGSLGKWCLTQGNIKKNIWLKLFFKPFIKNIYWHVTAKNEKNDVLNVFPKVLDSHFLIIPNGINNQQHNFISKDKLLLTFGLSPSLKYVLSSGRIDDKKGFDYTIQAMTYINDLDLVIMGEDYGSKNKLLALAKSLNVQDRVHFIGHIDDTFKWSFYKHASVFSLNSRHENFGNVYLESLSVGTPIISSTFTPWGFIGDTKAGFCIENNPVEISKKISLIINDKSYSERECKSVASEFYWNEIATQFISEYKRILNEY